MTKPGYQLRSWILFLPPPFGIMRVTLSLLLIVLVLTAGACATTSTGGSRSKSGTLTLEEINGAGLVFTNAYEIVRQFRPQWLIKRGRAKISSQAYDYVVVYVDNIREGDPETLHNITALSVQEIEHYNMAQAQRLGPIAHPHGAIVVRTRTR